MNKNKNQEYGSSKSKFKFVWLRTLGSVWFVVNLFLLTCVSTPDFAGLGRGADRVPLDGRVLTGTLPSGLKFFILENSLPQNRAHLALVVNAGSVLERDDQRGFAHFVEHMAFKGTARFPEMELIDYLRSLGMRFGPDANAYTSYNETVYHFDVPIENIGGVKHIPERALAILDDWTHAVKFNPEDVDSERRVVLEEMRARLGVNDRIRRRMLPFLFAGSAYADRDVIGLAQIIESATAQQLKEFYDFWYTPDNMALVFVGDFDGVALRDSLVNHFNMNARARPVNRPNYELPPPRSGNFQVEFITDPEVTYSELSMFFKQRLDAQRGTLAYYRQSIIDYLINVMLSLRFDEYASDPNAAATESWGGLWRWGRDSSFYNMGTSPKNEQMEQAFSALLTEKESIRRYGFTQSELDRAKLNIVSYMRRMLSERDRTESQVFVRSLINHFLLGEDFADIEWEVEAINLLLPGITLAEISRTVQNYFSGNDVKVLVIAPQNQAETLPSAVRIREMYDNAARLVITPRQDESLDARLLENVPAAGTIISETRDEGTGATILTLSNGARVILQETANRNNEIILYAMANGGTVNASTQTAVSVNLLSEMINVSGLGPYSRTELINMLTGKQVASSFWTSSYYRGFQGSSTTQDINTLFEMLHLFFTNPRLDERAIAAMIDQYRTNLANIDDNPQRWFSRQLNKILTSNHPLFLPLEVADMNRVSIQHARDFLQRCLNPGDYTFIFTGNIDMDVMRELSKTYIASIPTSASMNAWVNPNITRPPQGRTTLNRGMDERCIVYLTWMSRAPTAFNEQRNQVSAVLSEYLDILLTDEIREKLGGVYGISASASSSVIPTGENNLTVYFICDPARSDELIAAAIELINQTARQPINTEIFDKAKEANLMQHERSIQSNLHIAQSYANSFVLYNTPLARLNNRANAIRAVTAQDMQSLCREMAAGRLVQVVMLPDR